MTKVTYVDQLPNLPPRPVDAHKGTFGRALVIAGSEGMGGAAALAGMAALHGGAGLVTVAAPISVATIVAIAHPSYMTIPLDEVGGALSAQAVDQLKDVIDEQDAVALGPGLGRSDDVTSFCAAIFGRCPTPLVVDADGLNALATRKLPLKSRASKTARILTPHLGEFSRLLGLTVDEVKTAAQELAIDFASKNQVVLLLKGHRTIVTDGERVAINQSGCNALATGGSGDILTGLIVALLAQGMPAFEASQFAAHLHGVMGTCASEKHSERFITSVELLACIDDAWKEVVP